LQNKPLCECDDASREVSPKGGQFSERFGLNLTTAAAKTTTELPGGGGLEVLGSPSLEWVEARH